MRLECSHPVGESTDEFGNSWLCLTDMPGDDRREFRFTYRALVEVLPQIYRWEAFPPSFPEPPAHFVQPEPGLESDDSAVLNLAGQIMATSPLAVLGEAFALVRRTLTYRLKKKEYGARYAARHGEGDCTEYASLFAAILRAHNIGARINMGYCGNDLHAIAEVYLGGLWVPVEITNCHTPVLGLNQEFITLLRTNWICPGTTSQIIAFYYQSSQPCTPNISTSVAVSRADSPKKVRLVGDAESLPHTFSCKSHNAALTAHLGKDGQDYAVDIQNNTDWALSARIVSTGSHEVLKISPLLCGAREIIRENLSAREVRGQLKAHPTLQLWLVDDAEQSRLIGEIKRKDLISLLPS